MPYLTRRATPLLVKEGIPFLVRGYTPLVGGSWPGREKPQQTKPGGGMKPPLTTSLSAPISVEYSWAGCIEHILFQIYDTFIKYIRHVTQLQRIIYSQGIYEFYHFYVFNFENVQLSGTSEVTTQDLLGIQLWNCKTKIAIVWPKIWNSFKNMW